MRRRLLIAKPFRLDAAVALVGVFSSAAVGSISGTGDVSVSLTGVSSAAAVGSTTVSVGTSVSVAATGVSSAGAVGSVGVSVPQPWDISTASFAQSFSIGGQESLALSMFFKPDGTKMYIVGFSGDDVNEYDLGTAWDVSTSSYTRNFSVSSQSADPSGVFFKADGTRMYIAGSADSEINEYSLSTAWNVSTASYVRNFSVSGQDSFPAGVFFKDDGSKMYVLGNDNRFVNEYNLGTAWNISTASYLQNFSVSSQDSGPFGLFFKPDGSKMYMVGDSGNDVNEYDLSSAWDISTASFLQNFSVSSQDTNPSGISFKPDGTKMYVVGYSADNVNEYDLG